MADEVNELIRQLRDKEKYNPWEAIEDLIKIGPPAVEPLISTLRDKNKDVRKAASEALDKIKQTNAHLLTSYPHLFCTSCYMRANIIKVKTGIFKRKSFVLCRHCKGSRFLLKGIKQVIGLIGGDIDGYQVEGDSVYVKLWDEEKEESRNADTDILEIRGSSKPINYALAIASLYTTLYNDVSRPREYVKGIKVVIRSVPFSEDALDLLRSKFGEITHA